MIVRDAYGHEHEIGDDFEQDFELELAWLKPWGNTRAHFRTIAALKSAQKAAALLQLRSKGRRFSPPATVTLIRVVSRSMLDDDNVPDAMKYIRDTIAIDWLGHRSDRVPGLRFLYGQQKTSRPRHCAVRVTIQRHEPKEDATP